MSSAALILVLGMSFTVVLKITCFVLGYLTIRTGAGLLRDGITGEFKFNASLTGFKSDLASASPGLLFLVVGGILIGYAMGVEKPFDYEKVAAAAPAEPAPPTALPVK